MRSRKSTNLQDGVYTEGRSHETFNRLASSAGSDVDLDGRLFQGDTNAYTGTANRNTCTAHPDASTTDAYAGTANTYARTADTDAGTAHSNTSASHTDTSTTECLVTGCGGRVGGWAGLYYGGGVV